MEDSFSAMQGLTAVLMGVLFGFFGLALEPPPAPTGPTAAEREAQIKACETTCDQSEDETDRVTCRLNCKQATEGKDDVRYVRWKTEKHVGGTVPGQAPPPPAKTTVTSVTAQGTTTEVKTAPTAPSPKVETAPSPKVVQPPTMPPAVEQSPRKKYYFGLVDCQDRCNANTDAPGRARCKLRCLKLQPRMAPAAAPASR